MPLAPGDRLILASKARLVRDRSSGREIVLYPERGLALNPVAAAVAVRLDGARTVAAIAAEVAASFAAARPDEVERDVLAFLEELAERGLLEERDAARTVVEDAAARGALPGAEAVSAPEGGAAGDAALGGAAGDAALGGAAGDAALHRPYTLIAELTHRCPLRCPYCSNPMELSGAAGELSTETWCRVFAEAAELGVMQLHLTGGEPLARRDLEALVRGARGAGLYTNLITSGVPLARERLAALRAAGLDNVQLSVQDADAERADRIAGYAAFDPKLAVAGWVKAEGLPLTVNVVLHRENIEHVPAIVALAERLGADRLELANTQYLGWALANREVLLPTRDQLERAFAVASAARERLLGRMEMVFVTPDYYAAWPRACMDGWARRYLHIAPDGLVLPCHAAHTIPGLRFETVRERSLGWIWREAPSMNRFRGDAWMAPSCRGCDRREVDFGGCRCQAYHLTGDAAATDPACSLSPAHGVVEEARLRAASAASAQGEPRYLHRGAPQVHRGAPR
ncbi:pyrroloquinoline quinone biosynthesis protein PqqE [Sorangium sp. So ce590]